VGEITADTVAQYMRQAWRELQTQAALNQFDYERGYSMAKRKKRDRSFYGLDNPPTDEIQLSPEEQEENRAMLPVLEEMVGHHWHYRHDPYVRAQVRALIQRIREVRS